MVAGKSGREENLAMFDTLTYTEWDTLTSKIERSIAALGAAPGRAGTPVHDDALDLHGELVTTVKASIMLPCGCPLLLVEETDAHQAGCVYAPLCRTCGFTHPPAGTCPPPPRAFATEQEARDFRQAHDDDAKALARMPKAQLDRVAAAERAQHGQELLFGQSSKDELVGEILRLRYPTAKLREVIHVLGHTEIWPGCALCVPQEPEPGRLDGCTCQPVRGSHRPSCLWAAR